ncbi:hypothetical protein BHU72_08530 [Desulfuribacillus stibiiarsenatis]|uniref:DUF502 domain-containing protein n=1 Tax=Desulfuribacillus stibiiarsenatis TaxID=1390249 RepID=A0A1E5L328_9FIRM|nr:DUF502 domain-containing protein [Desulfuribacillus stibiiarsenatis]OEH84545.1 hypothetical protein BHU72_08530 [Desulfuribacillus stibiiarsenatis]
MRRVFAIFLKGIFILAPIVLTFYIIYNVYFFTDGLFKGLLEKAGFYYPGLGAVVTLATIFLVGLLASNWITNSIIRYTEKAIIVTPLIGKIYSIIKDTIHSFSNNRKGFTRLVLVSMPNDIKLLGFLTNDDDQVFIPKGYVAVYLMQSMQVAGNLILVPEHTVEPVEASPEDALKFIASAGMLKGSR